MSTLGPAIVAAVPLAAGWSLHGWRLRRRLAAARRDPLTGLRTRAAFEAAAVRLLAGGPRAVLLADLDGFKGINDNYGHGGGDAVLAAAGQRLARWAADRHGIAARLGGDEFAALIPCTGRTDLDGELARLHAALCVPVPYEGIALTCGASIGAIHTAVPAADGLPRLLRRADEAMYAAKRGGGGRRIADGITPTHATVHGRRAGRGGAHTTIPRSSS